MKFARFLVLLAITGVVPGVLMQTAAQQEIDPEHFDTAELAQTAKSAKRPTVIARAADSRKDVGATRNASGGSRSISRPPQGRPERQGVALLSTRQANKANVEQR
jgi:predicted TIM-barrel fold metal-dependent hydrolase